MNIEPVVKPVFFSEKVVIMSPVRASDIPCYLLQLTALYRQSATRRLQQVNTELHSEESDMEFLRITFPKLSQTIESSFTDEYIKNIQIEQLEDLRKRATSQKRTDQQHFKIDVVGNNNTVAQVIKLRNA